ncbi:MAG: ComEA family DNA-binding protein [Polyangiales bacterium]
MLERSTVGALGIVLGVLCLASLAHLHDRAQLAEARVSPLLPRAEIAAPKVPVATQTPRDEPRPDAVRALRDGEPLDLNRAEAAELELLPGIGPKLARRIVDDRRSHGLYRRVSQLVRVRGVGPRTLARLRALVSVEPEGRGRAPAAAKPSAIEHEDHGRGERQVQRIATQSGEEQAGPQVELQGHLP